MAAISSLLRSGPFLLSNGGYFSSSIIKIFPYHRSSFFSPLFSTLPSQILSIEAENSNFFDPFSYGPSLRKGIKRTPIIEEEIGEQKADPEAIDRERFARVFLLAALRVPAMRCSDLENRLRGHLLNWPRIRNVARVPGDELDPSVSKLLKASILRENGESEQYLNPVQYREKLAKEFNHRGFVKFRNLAKLSRPRKRKKETSGERNAEKGEIGEKRGKNEFAIVELVEPHGEGEEEVEERWKELIGDGFSGEEWRGSTRLLLLDERYADRGYDDLPEAIKAVIQEERTPGELPLELVQCRLTLTYDYWSTNEILEDLLPTSIVVPSAFETVGHIAHLNLRDEHLPFRKLIARVILDKNWPKIRTVVNKTEAIQNDFRTMPLEVLAGNHSLVTTLVEGGARFQVNLTTVYWNSRLATERQRLIGLFNSEDVVCDVFAGAGPISIAAARKVRRVYANDLNPAAVDYLRSNVSLNKLDRKVKVFNMDGRRFIETVFSLETSLPGSSIVHVVMNLPKDAVDFLDVFRGIFIGLGAKPTIHVYGFSKSHDPEFDFRERIAMALCCELPLEVNVHRVRLVAPSKWMLCASFLLPTKI